jgi:hypothetical protein
MKMKRALLIMALSLTATSMFAQGGGSSITSKKGEMYLPQAGDWAISMDATPWLTYFGNFFHGNGTTAAPTAAFLNQNQTIVGKYFVDDNTAYRALIRIGVNSYSQNNEIFGSSVSDTATPHPQVEDQRTISNHFVGIGAGIEKRKGSTRLQGYYGVELMFYLAGSDTTYSYGNSYSTATDPTPTYTSNWNTGGTSQFGLGAPRFTANGPGSTFGINVVGFIGFEYFFAPKISIGGEYTWGIGFHSTGQGSYTVEEISGTTGADLTDTYKSGGNSGFSLDTGLNQAFGSGTGSLYITFHF